MGTPIAYDADGKAFQGTLTANLGAAVNWATNNTWQGTLPSGEPTTLAFSVRESELASTVKTPGAQGAVIVAIESETTDAQLDVTGATVLGTATHGTTRTTLVRVTEAGTKLITLTGNGAASVRIALAGDLNRDGSLDSLAWEQSPPNADLNGDGLVFGAVRLNVEEGIAVAQAGIPEQDLTTTQKIPVHAVEAAEELIAVTGPDASATITIQSVLPPDYDTTPAPAVDLGALDVLYTDGTIPVEASGITIDWTPPPASASTATTSVSSDHWLIDFLGLAEPVVPDLAEMTGLVVRLDSSDVVAVDGATSGVN